MVIGDDSHFCYLMQTYVRKSDHQIISTFLGEDVLEQAQNEKPAAIVLEVGSSGSAGWHLLRKFKSHASTADIPILICSWADEEKRGSEQGASASLRMPILYEDFAKALSTIGITS
jgi:DNA-binding response OmpR family regulator